MTWHCPECSKPHDHDTVEPTLCEACEVRAELRVECAKRQLLGSRLAWFEGTDLAKAYQELLCVRGELNDAREISDGLRAELEDARAGRLDVPDTLEDDADLTTQLAFRLRWLEEELKLRTRERDEWRLRYERYRDAPPIDHQQRYADGVFDAPASQPPSGRDLYRSGSSPCCGAVMCYAHGTHPFCNECEQGYHNDTGELLPAPLATADDLHKLKQIGGCVMGPRHEWVEIAGALRCVNCGRRADDLPRFDAPEVTDELVEDIRAELAQPRRRNDLELTPEEHAEVDREVAALKAWLNTDEGAEAVRAASERSAKAAARRAREQEPAYGAPVVRKRPSRTELSADDADGWPRIAAFVTSMEEE